MWSTSKLLEFDVTAPSYSDRHRPPTTRQPTTEPLIRSLMRTSSRVSHPSLPATIQWRKSSRE
ncbi:unannotated protein [freshwater metagenome]|uniref:Unannotated protein n=1 Tax=freshwater metagenome TaxID=449393 RepID=A0A6J7F6G0_9ZZZZ